MTTQEKVRREPEKAVITAIASVNCYQVKRSK